MPICHIKNVSSNKKIQIFLKRFMLFKINIEVITEGEGVTNADFLIT